MNFKKDYKQVRYINDGVQYLFKFDNNYGASVVKHSFSYGGNNGLWELAVIKYTKDGSNWKIAYDTTITNDVIGNLPEDEINKLLKDVEALN